MAQVLAGSSRPCSAPLSSSNANVAKGEEAMAMEQQQQPYAQLVNHDEDREETTLEPQVLYNCPITKDMPNEIRMGFVKKVPKKGDEELCQKPPSQTASPRYP